MSLVIVVTAPLTKEPGLPPAIVIWFVYVVYACRSLRGWWHGEKMAASTIAVFFFTFVFFTYLLIDAFVLWWGHQHP